MFEWNGVECGIGWVRVKWGGVRSVKLVGARERNGSGRLGIPDLGNREKSYFYPKERISSKSKNTRFEVLYMV